MVLVSMVISNPGELNHGKEKANKQLIYVVMAALLQL